jgi:WD40 repeat protein
VEILPSLTGHEHSVLCVAFSPDGRQIVSGSSDRTIRLWSVRSGIQIISPLLGHEDGIQGVAFSPDGTRVASGSAAGCVRIWNLMSCTETLCFTMGHGPEYPTSVAFSPDGRYIFAKFWKRMRVWDSSEACFAQTPNYLHDRCTLKDAIIITPEGWTADVRGVSIGLIRLGLMPKFGLLLLRSSLFWCCFGFRASFGWVSERSVPFGINGYLGPMQYNAAPSSPGLYTHFRRCCDNIS